MELATSTEETTDIEAATESENETESKRTSQGPDIELTESEPEKQDEKAEKEPEKSAAVEPGKVLESLKKHAEGKEKTPAPGNFDKGLQRVQERVGELTRQLEDSKAERQEIKALLSKIAEGKKPNQGELDLVPELSDEDFADGKTLRSAVKAALGTVSKEIAELKELQKKSVQELKQEVKPPPREMSSQEVVAHVESMYPDLDKQYAPYIIQQASPQMEQFKRDNPKATQAEQRLAASNFLNAQAYEIRLAIARESAVSVPASETKSEAKKPKGSTKIVEDSASPATLVNANRPMDSMGDAEDKWLNMPD